ncbi:MAG: hypothetical protein B6I20_01740 [Bacteroidetes bacterium 4572_117]|nr:MAG: hypothetical protein B6I20_01740 [Bacteroidetes bacterium 4572_117]
MKKYTSIYPLIFLFFISCQTEKKDKKTTENEKDSSEIIVAIQDDSLAEIKLHKKNIETGFNIDSFLQQPFDLYRFKSTKVASLSGSSHMKKYHLVPDKDWVAYRFFLFDPKKPNQIVNGKPKRNPQLGYIGPNKKKHHEMMKGLVITTYQPKDEFQHDYRNPNEILVELIAKYNDFDLPELAFVGIDSATVVSKLGDRFFYKNNCLVYTNKNIALIFKIENSKVKWLRYIRLSFYLNKETEIVGLYNI